MGSLLNNARRRSLVFVLVVLALLKFRSKFLKFRHAWVLLKKLPTTEVTDGEGLLWAINGVLANEIATSGERVSLIDLRTKALGAVQRLIEKTPNAAEVGLINLQMLNRKLDSLLPFNTLNPVILFGNEKVREFLSAKAMPKLAKGEFDPSDSLTAQTGYRHVL